MNTIFILPNTKQIEKIEFLRKKYDPLFGKIKPHITLVFPLKEFSESILKNVIDNVCSKNKKFKIITDKIIAHENMLFLTFKKEGNLLIKSLHNFFYNEDIPDNRIKDSKYVPHITLGVFENNEKIKKVVKEYENYINNEIIEINSICLERILDNDLSEIIYKKKLK